MENADSTDYYISILRFTFRLPIITVIPCLFASLNICITSKEVCESSAPVGSSANITLGCPIKARAMAMRLTLPYLPQPVPVRMTWS